MLSNMNSFERVVEYCEGIEQEQLDEDASGYLHWPSKGEIEIRNLTLAYHSKPDTDIIKDLHISIQAGEKIGVVGRTGSGKSTLAMSFFRLFEPKRGTIIIDDHDIRTVCLQALRRNISIISQEANVFTGTIRYNLTLGDFADEIIWQALDVVGLKSYVSELPQKLDHELTTNGGNLSFGQCQLLCLARVILRKPKVLILDEANSSIDLEADQKIQEVLRTHLKDTTVISIAHRLNSIADFDRVLVLEDGAMREYDSPYNLLLNDSSQFAEMVKSSGSSNARAIMEIARLQQK
ncbi:Multidrug resistance-associated protein 1 [Boothiomyces macroporosus]|uniref:Multidrug resistance-associated protein 1 n=1 Tax=Boothiomyces macroporosus TaxID=261099 RepID=A0AAD5UDC7_9FUNG|nr:Multidrug resistance-associated protein 1 [Boothiomyces macroporosus]